MFEGIYCKKCDRFLGVWENCCDDLHEFYCDKCVERILKDA